MRVVRGLEDVKLEDFGSAKSIEVLKNFTTIVGGEGDWEEIDKRMDGPKGRDQADRRDARLREITAQSNAIGKWSGDY